MDYFKFCAYSAANVSFVFNSFERYLDKETKLTLWQNVLKYLFIWTIIPEIALLLVLFIVSMIGKIIYLIPVLNYVFLILVNCIFAVILLFIVVGHCFEYETYIKHIRQNYISMARQIYNESRYSI